MRWIVEPNKTFPKWPYHVLITEPGVPLMQAFVEYWKRILTDGSSLAPAARTALAIEISARTVDADRPGRASAIFYTSVNKQSEGIGVYRLPSDHFTLLRAKNEDRQQFAKREVAWLLEQYTLLKQALQDSQAAPLLEHLNTTRKLAIRAGTSNGWFDVQPGQPDFGALPADDRLLLAGRQPLPSDPLADLTSGVLDVGWMRLTQEFNAALIQYTPPHFKTIHCKLTEGLEQGQRALFYDIQCPQFPDQGTDQPNERLQRAATRLVQHVTAEQGAFPGVLIKLNVQPDETWLHSLEFLAPPALTERLRRTPLFCFRRLQNRIAVVNSARVSPNVGSLILPRSYA